MVRKALITQYGSTNVESKDKALKIKFKSSNYAPADVVVALGYRKYSSYTDYIEGIGFLNRRTGEMIINYPKNIMKMELLNQNLRMEFSKVMFDY